MDHLKKRGLELPLIQGGMGVGVSLSGLAGAVAKTGAMGSISTADCGYREEDFLRCPEEANLRALRKEIRRAKELSGGRGLLSVNAMVATRQWADAVKVAVEEGIDAVISGAGLPLNLPELVPEGKAFIAPIISGGRAARILLKNWSQKYGRTADFVVSPSCRVLKRNSEGRFRFLRQEEYGAEKTFSERKRRGPMEYRWPPALSGRWNVTQVMPINNILSVKGRKISISFTVRWECREER